MIQEFWDFLTTKTTPWARKDGFLYYSVAMAHRAKRCQPYWTEHLKNCHHYVSEFYKKNPQAKTVALLGSGLLLETPLNLLPANIKKVYLIDAVHTKDARKAVLAEKISAEIEFVETNLNHAAALIEVDLVISGNLLSQVALVESEKQRRAKVPEDKIESYILEVQTHHLAQMTKWAQKGLLFSDYQMRILDKNGTTLEKTKTVLTNVPWQQKWEWNLAPAPEVSKTESIVLDVGLLEFS